MIRKLIVIVFCGLVHNSTCSRMRYEQPLQDPMFRNEMQFREPGMPCDTAFRREHIFPRDPMGQADPMRNPQLFGNDEMQPGVMPNGEFFRQQPVVPNDSFLRREPIMQRELLKRDQMMRPEQIMRNFPSPPPGFAIMLTQCQCPQEPQNFPPQGLGPQNFGPMQPQNFAPVAPQPFPPQNFAPLPPQIPAQNFAPAFQPLAPQPFQPIPAPGLGPMAPQGFQPMGPQETFLPIQPPMPGAPIITHRIMLPKPMMKQNVCQHMIDIPRIQRLVRQSFRPFSDNMQMAQSQVQQNQDYGNDASPFQGNYPSQAPSQEETSEQSPNNPATPRTPSLPTPLNLAQMSSIC